MRPLKPLLAVTAALTLLAATVPTLRATRAAAKPAGTAPTAAAQPAAVTLPPAEDAAKDALEHSPRHGEYVDIPYAGHRPLRTWVVYPERRDKAGVVLVVHEIFGLSDWIRGVADRLAGDGFIAVAPDLLSGMGPGGVCGTPSRCVSTGAVWRQSQRQRRDDHAPGRQ